MQEKNCQEWIPQFSLYLYINTIIDICCLLSSEEDAVALGEELQLKQKFETFRVNDA